MIDTIFLFLKSTRVFIFSRIIVSTIRILIIYLVLKPKRDREIRASLKVKVTLVESGLKQKIPIRPFSTRITICDSTRAFFSVCLLFSEIGQRIVDCHRIGDGYVAIRTQEAPLSPTSAFNRRDSTVCYTSCRPIVVTTSSSSPRACLSRPLCHLFRAVKSRVLVSPRACEGRER